MLDMIVSYMFKVAEQLKVEITLPPITAIDLFWRISIVKWYMNLCSIRIWVTIIGRQGGGGVSSLIHALMDPKLRGDHRMDSAEHMTWSKKRSARGGVSPDPLTYGPKIEGNHLIRSILPLTLPTYGYDRSRMWVSNRFLCLELIGKLSKSHWLSWLVI
jgi:hypothetical protein